MRVSRKTIVAALSVGDAAALVAFGSLSMWANFPTRWPWIRIVTTFWPTLVGLFVIGLLIAPLLVWSIVALARWERLRPLVAAVAGICAAGIASVLSVTLEMMRAVTEYVAGGMSPAVAIPRAAVLVPLHLVRTVMDVRWYPEGGLIVVGGAVVGIANLLVAKYALGRHEQLTRPVET